MCGYVLNEGRSQDEDLHGGARHIAVGVVSADGDHHSSDIMVIQGPAL